MRTSPTAIASAFLIVFGGSVGAVAQGATAIAHAPDMLGIYAGMPADQAKAQLQKHSADVYVQPNTTADGGFGMSVPGMPTDQISVSVTQAPNAPAVWRVERVQHFSNQKPLSRAELLEALHRKYGAETFLRSPDAGHREITWLYDSSGHPRAQADAGLQACNAAVPSAMSGEIASRCAQDFFALHVSILSMGTDGDSVQSYVMVLIDYPFATRAAALTAQARRAADANAPRQPTEKVPVL